MTRRFWPVVGFILFATIATDVRGEDARLCKQGAEASARGNYKLAVNLISLCIKNGQLKTKALGKAYYDRGTALIGLDRYKNALADLNLTIGMRLNMDRAYASRALVFARLDKHGLAIVDYGRAIRFKKDNAGLYYNRALSHIAEKDYQRALKDLDKAAALNPNFVGVVRHNQGIVFAKLRLYDKSVSAFNHAINLRWHQSIAYLNRGMMLLRAKKYDPAIRSLNYSISLKPNYGTAYTYRGLAREGLREKELAIADYKRAVDYGTTVEWTAKRIKQLKATN